LAERDSFNLVFDSCSDQVRWSDRQQGLCRDMNGVR